jgi:hypothetical protein
MRKLSTRLQCLPLRLALVLAIGGSALSAVPADSPLLPGQFGAWQSPGPSQILKIQDLGAPWASGTIGERILKEAGVLKIEERTYQNAEGSITLRAYLLPDPSSAFELYTYLLAPGMRDIGIGENSAGGANDGRFLVGNIVVESSLPSSVRPEELRSAFVVLQAKANRTPLPPLQSYLPAHSRINGSEKYALGPQAFQAALASLDQVAYADISRVVGFESGAEAILARFESGHNGGVLLLIEYPTPQLAEQHLHHLQAALPVAAKQAGVRIERKASLLALVLSSDSEAFANKLRQDVNYETQITWNEGSHVATEPPMVVMIIKIFTYTGLFLAVATGLGLLFGILRVFIKRYFPGKVFDRPEDVEILQMGLSGKKIDSSDMY